MKAKSIFMQRDGSDCNRLKFKGKILEMKKGSAY